MSLEDQDTHFNYTRAYNIHVDYCTDVRNQKQYMLTLQIRRYWVLALQNRIVLFFQQTQNMCITLIQRRPSVFDVGSTLYKCYTNVFCLLGVFGFEPVEPVYKREGCYESVIQLYIRWLHSSTNMTGWFFNCISPTCNSHFCLYKVFITIQTVECRQPSYQ